MDIIVRLVAQGAAQLTGALNQAATATERVGTQAAGAARGTSELDHSLDATADSARGAAGGLDTAARAADHLENESAGAATQSNGLGAALEKTRNAGIALTAAGAVGLAITGKMIEAANEGNGLEAKLESILETQGRLQDLGSINNAIDDVRTKGNFDDDDGLRDAAIHLASFGVASKDIGDLLPRVGRQVRTGFGDLTSVADGLGKAYAAMDLAPLKRSGLVFTDLEEASVKAAAGISEAAGKAKFMEVVMAGIDRNTVTLEGSLTGAEAAANNLANAADGAMTNLGAGAGAAKMQVDTVLASILGIVNASPNLESAAGYLSYFVSGGLTVVGSLLAVGSQIGMTALAFQGMGITGVGAWTAVRTAAISAGAATWAAIAPLIPIIAAVAAVALIAAGALYLLDRAWHAKEDGELAANIARGDEAGQKLLEMHNKKRAKRGQAPLTMEQFEGSPGADLLKDNAGAGDKGAADIDAMTAKLAAIQSGAGAPMAPPAMAIMPPAPVATAAAPVISASRAALSKLPKAPINDRVQTALRLGAHLTENGRGVEVEKGTSDLSQSDVDDLFKLLEGRAKNTSGRAQKALLMGAHLTEYGQGIEVEKGTPALSQSDVDDLFRALDPAAIVERQMRPATPLKTRGGAKAGAAQSAGEAQSHQITVPLSNRLEQDGSGDFWIHFAAEPVKIPRQGLGALRGRLR